MKPYKIGLALASAGVLAAAAGCKNFFDVNVNPLSPVSVGLYSLLPVTQVSMAENLGNNIGGLSQYTMALMQQLYNTRNIGNFQQTGDSFTGPWAGLYRGVLVNNELIITQGTQEQRWDYVGIAQLQKAYVVSQMVDLWGDIPYSEALRGAANPAPRFDRDEDIYNGTSSIQGLFTLIDEGLANLAKTGVLPTSPVLSSVDLVYRGSGNIEKWARFGRTLKLKLYNQLRKTKSAAEVQNLVRPLLNAPGSLMQEGEDFQLTYSGTVNPDNRHPGYAADYSANPENRIGRYFYEDMFRNNDPRIPYYFYHQVGRGAPPVTQQDYVSSLDPRFVTVRPGSSGPFVSSASTANFQTIQGLYPVGGRYDDGIGGKNTQNPGKAKAPQRLLTYYSRKYIEAELQLTVFNDAAAARIALRQALYASFHKVNTIAAEDGSPVMDTTRTSAAGRYILAALGRYNTAPNTDEKLEVIMYEKYVASFGYGVDVYTDFRRTQHPRIRVSQQVANPSRGLLPDDGATQGNGVFPRRLFYPINDLLLNPNSPGSQRDPNAPIFWDR